LAIHLSPVELFDRRHSIATRLVNNFTRAFWGPVRVEVYGRFENFSHGLKQATDVFPSDLRVQVRDHHPAARLLGTRGERTGWWLYSHRWDRRLTDRER
jgi:hypothetical protein